MIRNFTDDLEDITTPLGEAFALRFLDHIRARIVEIQEETGHLYNLEATPAEGTTYRFARKTANALQTSCKPARPTCLTTPTLRSYPWAL